MMVRTSYRRFAALDDLDFLPGFDATLADQDKTRAAQKKGPEWKQADAPEAGTS